MHQNLGSRTSVITKKILKVSFRYLGTLPHIFLQCAHTHPFRLRLSAFITLKLDHHYRDRNNYHFITCNHFNSIINFINMVSKWYINKQFQKHQSFDWSGFKRWIKLVIFGENNLSKLRWRKPDCWLDLTYCSCILFPILKTFFI